MLYLESCDFICSLSCEIEKHATARTVDVFDEQQHSVNKYRLWRNSSFLMHIIPTISCSQYSTFNIQFWDRRILDKFLVLSSHLSIHNFKFLSPCALRVFSVRRISRVFRIPSFATFQTSTLSFLCFSCFSILHSLSIFLPPLVLSIFSLSQRPRLYYSTHNHPLLFTYPYKPEQLWHHPHKIHEQTTCTTNATQFPFSSFLLLKPKPSQRRLRDTTILN